MKTKKKKAISTLTIVGGSCMFIYAIPTYLSLVGKIANIIDGKMVIAIGIASLITGMYLMFSHPINSTKQHNKPDDTHNPRGGF